MPNTLAHFGIQAVSSRALLGDSDVKWIFLGCLLSDVAWILYRILRACTEVSAYDLRLYAIVQSSLAFSIVLAGALSLFSVSPLRVFIILSLNSLFHLLLDACQTKLANGVHLFAPVSWQLLNFRLFWPESVPTILLTAFGAMYCVLGWRRRQARAIDLAVRSRTHLLLGGVGLVIYLFLPLALLAGPEMADNHYIQTLRERASRTGKPVEFDRASVVVHDGGITLRTFAGEEVEVTSGGPDYSARISAQGAFTSPSSVVFHDSHEHWGRARDIPSYVGLVVLVAFFARDLLRSRSARAPSARPGGRSGGREGER